MRDAPCVQLHTQAACSSHTGASTQAPKAAWSPAGSPAAGHSAAAALQLSVHPLRLRAPLLTFRAPSLDRPQRRQLRSPSRPSALNVSKGTCRRSGRRPSSRAAVAPWPACRTPGALHEAACKAVHASHTAQERALLQVRLKHWQAKTPAGRYSRAAHRCRPDSTGSPLQPHPWPQAPAGQRPPHGIAVHHRTAGVQHAAAEGELANARHAGRQLVGPHLSHKKPLNTGKTKNP